MIRGMASPFGAQDTPAASSVFWPPAPERNGEGCGVAVSSCKFAAWGVAPIGCSCAACCEGSSRSARSRSACSTQMRARTPSPTRAAFVMRPSAIQFETAEGPLLRTTGATSSCASRWGDDAIYDMVGNIDEWVDEKGGAFAGGFYSRSTTNGCEALVTAHPTAYADYSTGVRCCKDAR